MAAPLSRWTLEPSHDPPHQSLALKFENVFNTEHSSGESNRHRGLGAFCPESREDPKEVLAFLWQRLIS